MKNLKVKIEIEYEVKHSSSSVEDARSMFENVLQNISSEFRGSGAIVSTLFKTQRENVLDDYYEENKNTNNQIADM